MKLTDVKDKRVRTQIKRQRQFQSVVKKQLSAYDLINPMVEKGEIEFEEDEQQDVKLTQDQLKKSIDVGTAKKLFNFRLKGGPYMMVPTRNGKHVVIGGKGGQLSVFDRTTMFPICDFTVDENVLDVSFLHNYTMFAAAQRKHTYIYDSISGAEIHCLKDQARVTHLDFLPYHFLLASWSETGIMRYLDTSTGQQVARHFSKMGPCHSFRQNMATALVNVGHSDGCVSLWTPSQAEPVMKIRAHYGAVSALGCHDQTTLITGGGDHKWKIWDLRKASQPVVAHSYKGAPPSSIDVSQSGMIAVGNGVRINVFSQDTLKSGSHKSYLSHHIPDGINSLRFCPFEDILLLGEGSGIGTMLVPGSGSGDVDTFTNNPFETRSQRRETEVRSLIEKLRPDMISLPFIVETIGTLATPEREEDSKPQKKVLGKKQLKRRSVNDTAVRVEETKLERLGKVASDGKYDALTRFR